MTVIGGAGVSPEELRQILEDIKKGGPQHRGPRVDISGLFN